MPLRSIILPPLSLATSIIAFSAGWMAGEMAGEDRMVVVEVGDEAAHAQNAVAGVGGHVELIQCVQRQSES